MGDLRPKGSGQVRPGPAAARPSPALGPPAPGSCPVQGGGSAETQNEVFVWSLPPGFAGPVSLSHHSRSGWQTPGWLVGGYYVSIGLIVSKSLGKQEGISIKEFDPGFFVSLSSKLVLLTVPGSLDCVPRARRGHFLPRVEPRLGGWGS